MRRQEQAGDAEFTLDCQDGATTPARNDDVTRPDIVTCGDVRFAVLTDDGYLRGDCDRFEWAAEGVTLRIGPEHVSKYLVLADYYFLQIFGESQAEDHVRLAVGSYNRITGVAHTKATCSGCPGAGEV